MRRKFLDLQMNDKKQGIRGQAIVEYMLTISLSVSVVLLFSQGIKKIGQFVWDSVICDVTAPCPGCKLPAEISKSELSRGSCKGR